MISLCEHLTILPTVDSTNNYAMAQVRAGLAKQGHAFFALEQTAGKGQRGEGWHTQSGSNIILSLVLQPIWLPIAQQFRLSSAVALGCFDLFASYAGEETKIKWPNDIYWRDRKAGGILIENIVGEAKTGPVNEADNHLKTQGNQQKVAAPVSALWQWSIVGIGINVNQTHFPDHLPNPVSLKQITGSQSEVISLTRELCSHIEYRLDQLQENKDLVAEYNNALYMRHSTVRLKKGNRVFDAAIRGVNDSGQLMVKTAIEEQFDFGSVQWLIS